MLNVLRLCALLVLAAAAGAAEVVFTPLTHPTGECNMEAHPGQWFRPDLGSAADVIPLKTRVYATQESVTDGLALKLIFEKGSKGVIAWEKGGKGKPDPKAAGFTLFAKASKPVKFRICTNVNAEQKGVVEIGTEWKKYDFAYADIGYSDDWWQIMFQVIGPIEERTWLILDRVGTEAPSFSKDPKIDPKSGPDQTLSSKDILYGAENLAKTLARAKAKQPFKIIAVGDSISAGAQTMRGTWGVKVPEGLPFRYFGTMARVWEEEFGYKGIKPVDCAHGGWTTKQLLNVVDKEALSQCSADDVVVLQSGGNDIMAGTTVAQFKADLKQMIAKVKTKTDQIILVDSAIAAGGPVAKAAEALTKMLKDLVEEEKVAAADLTRLMTYRGDNFGCGLLANAYHPDFCGHIMIGEMFAPLLTGKHKTYPE